MKKLFSMFLAVAFALTLAGMAVADDNAAKPAKAAEKSATSAEKAAKGQKVSGTIEALDAAAGTFTVKGKKGNVDLKAGEKVKLDSFKVGDKVDVKYADGTASAVKAVKSKKTETKTETKPETKPETKTVPAAPPAPAEPPVPAEKK